MKEEKMHTPTPDAAQEAQRAQKFAALIEGEYREAFEQAVRERMQRCTDGRLADSQTREAQLRERFERLQRDFAQVRERYPQAQLAKELENPRFMRTVACGVDACGAYELAHFAELQREAMAYAARRTREDLTAAAQAGYLRPREGGMTAAGGGTFDEDAAKWSRETRDEMKTRARRGEKVRL